MKKIYRHKLTKQLMMIKVEHPVVSTLFILDENGNKIRTNSYNVHGEPNYERAVCLMSNLELVK